MHNSKCRMRYCCSGSVGSLCRCSPHTKSSINIQMEDYSSVLPCKGGCGCIQRDRALQENAFEDSHSRHNFLFCLLVCVLSETQKEMLTCLLYYTLYGG